ncbi:MAG: hypothetical protein A3E84_03145 [Gammaproteobacteria bacterium RIFCSPHIGHO2_12_FULL_42_13]|nr:MAG: hypothetical protein A3E84_03145 [Gammaproteobacteria bacterium RIFCSPHIGHO2_12_FULL_42_13]
MTITEQQAKREKWKTLIAEYEKSGLSKIAFCKRNELSSAQFGYYRGVFKSKQNEPKKLPNAFVPVKINQQKCVGEIRLTLPNGFQCTFPSDMALLKCARQIILSHINIYALC